MDIFVLKESVAEPLASYHIEHIYVFSTKEGALKFACRTIMDTIDDDWNTSEPYYGKLASDIQSDIKANKLPIAIAKYNGVINPHNKVKAWAISQQELCHG